LSSGPRPDLTGFLGECPATMESKSATQHITHRPCEHSSSSLQPFPPSLGPQTVLKGMCPYGHMLYVHTHPFFTICPRGRGGASQALHYLLLSDICGRVGRNADNFDAMQRARPFENPVESSPHCTVVDYSNCISQSRGF
jgi:hypothetical protein